MPEGPEIRRAADRVAAAIEGRPADDVFFAFGRLKRFEEVLIGQVVDEVTTRGKAMLTRFAGGLSVYSHNQLYGRWYVMSGSRMPKTGRQLRFAVSAGNRRAMLYSASDIEVLDRDAERDHPFLSRLGPDLLSERPSSGELADRLAEPRFCGRQLGALLLDQRFVAGLGNYLRADILFEAGIHPRRRASDCDEDERNRLADRMNVLVRRAYRTRGVTLPDGRYTALRTSGVTRPAARFWVYGREGDPCRICDAVVEQAAVGGRKVFWCPRCQPDRGRR